MKSYDVLWSDEAEDQLIGLTALETNRSRCVEAIRQIETKLRDDPYHCSPVHEGLWAFEVVEFRSLFEIHDSESVVRVVSFRDLTLDA